MTTCLGRSMFTRIHAEEHCFCSCCHITYNAVYLFNLLLILCAILQCETQMSCVWVGVWRKEHPWEHMPVTQTTLRLFLWKAERSEVIWQVTLNILCVFTSSDSSVCTAVCGVPAHVRATSICCCMWCPWHSGSCHSITVVVSPELKPTEGSEVT